MRWVVLSAALIVGTVYAQSPAPTMKAMLAQQWGGPEILKLEDVALPQPKENELLIKSFAAGVNSFDEALLAGKYAKVSERACLGFQGTTWPGWSKKSGPA
jgi:hypothetical protein